MGFFKKKRDPITERERALSAEIAALEERIKKLASQEAHVHPLDGPSAPRLRSTTLPHGQSAPGHPISSPAAAEAVFEEMSQSRLKDQTEPATPEHFNELGVRKYDLSALWRRWKNNFRGPATSNPRLVNYLAAGSIQGLRPLRYEKRVARNRFIALVVLLILALWGIIAALIRR